MKFGDCVIILSNKMFGVVLDRIYPTSINNYMSAYLIKTAVGLVLVEPNLVESLDLSILDL